MSCWENFSYVYVFCFKSWEFPVYYLGSASALWASRWALWGFAVNAVSWVNLSGMRFGWTRNYINWQFLNSNQDVTLEHAKKILKVCNILVSFFFHIFEAVRASKKQVKHLFQRLQNFVNSKKVHLSCHGWGLWALQEVLLIFCK